VSKKESVTSPVISQIFLKVLRNVTMVYHFLVVFFKMFRFENAFKDL